MLALVVFFCQDVMAVSNTTSTTVSGDLGMGDRITSLLMGLAAVIGLIFASAWVYKKTGRIQQLGNAQINILARQSLGTREKIILVEANGQTLLLGVTTASIQTLHTYDKSQNFDAILKSQQKGNDNED